MVPRRERGFPPVAAAGFHTLGISYNVGKYENDLPPLPRKEEQQGRLQAYRLESPCRLWFKSNFRVTISYESLDITAMTESVTEH